MNKQEGKPGPDWLDINAAATFARRSTSTIRRWIDRLSEQEAGEHVRREKMPGQGGEKILIARAFLAERFGVAGDDQHGGAAAGSGGQDPPGLVGILEKQIEAKDRQISNLQRQVDQAQTLAADLSERLREQSYLAGQLQGRLLSLTDRAGGDGSQGPADGEGSAPGARWSHWYTVAIAVLFAVAAFLLLHLVLA